MGYQRFSLSGGPIEQTFELRIAHGSVPKEMHILRVKQGDLVKLRWTTDESMVLHPHGYDIEKKVKPGAATEFAFKAHATGRFPINVHDPGEHAHGQSHDESTLVYVEVYPR